MTLRALLEGVDVLAVTGDTSHEVPGLALDSRRVKPGDVFFALPGTKADGLAFARAAVAAGAGAVVAAPGAAVEGATRVEVADPRLAMAQAAVRFHGEPSHALAVVGVTGTNGKTTTTWLLESIFRAAGWRAGVLGTTGIRVDGETRPSSFTTPEAPDLQAVLAEMRDRGVRAVAMEVSSHALVQRRAWGLACDVAVFTNLTQDHLDYHGTMDAYLDAKLALFDGRNGPNPKRATAVVNADDPAAPRVIEAARRGGMAVHTFGTDAGAGKHALSLDLAIESLVPRPDGLALELFVERGPEIGERVLTLPMLGRFNALNAAGAYLAALALGIAPSAIEQGLSAFAGVPGRLERVDGGREFVGVVDYAHTPDALERTLAACREHARGRVLVVFGCGGDRDRGKRPQMGAIAARLADRAWVTNDNPRSEDPAAIAAEVVAGAPAAGLAVVLDRRQAIADAVAAARAGDVVLIAGKGHETTQTIGADVLPFDDRQVAREALAARGDAR